MSAFFLSSKEVIMIRVRNVQTTDKTSENKRLLKCRSKQIVLSHNNKKHRKAAVKSITLGAGGTKGKTMPLTPPWPPWPYLWRGVTISYFCDRHAGGTQRCSVPGAGESGRSADWDSQERGGRRVWGGWLGKIMENPHGTPRKTFLDVGGENHFPTWGRVSTFSSWFMALRP